MSDSDTYTFKPVDEEIARVACAHCGEMIVAASTRCEKCGVHFQGTAAEFATFTETRFNHALEGYRPRAAGLGNHPVLRRAAWVILIVLAIMVLVLLVAGVWSATR